MELKNKTLIQEIEFWESKFPYLESFFKLGLVEGFITVADILIPDEEKHEKLIVDFVSGLIDIFLYIQTENNDYLDEFEIKTNGFFKLVTKTLKSEEYLNNLINTSIPDSRALPFEGTFKTKDEIKFYIQRIRAVPLTIKDLDSIELDLIEFTRNKYQRQKAKKDDIFKESIVTIIDGDKWDTEEVYKQFNDVLFKCDKDVFNDWFVTGKGNSEIPKIIKGVALRQVFFLLQQIVINPNETKETYFNAVFNKKYSKDQIKSKDYVGDFKDKFKPKLALCRIIAKKQP